MTKRKYRALLIGLAALIAVVAGGTYSTTSAIADAAVSGYKWIDVFPDGQWDQANEPAALGWTIELWDVTGTPVPLASGTTSGSGWYEFSALLPGRSYAVCELLDFAHVQTFPSATTPDPDPPKEVIFDCTVLGSSYGPYGYQFTPVSGDTFSGYNFGNFEPPVCPYTQGYWKTHSTYGPADSPDNGWYTPFGLYAPGVEGPGAQLFDAQFRDKDGTLQDMTWLAAFNHPAKGGNAWFILAQQWMAAYLNFYNGAGSGGSDVMQWIGDGAVLLDTWDQYDNGAPLIPKDAADRATAVELAGQLELYNSGYWAAGSCDG